MAENAISFKRTTYFLIFSLATISTHQAASLINLIIFYGIKSLATIRANR